MRSTPRRTTLSRFAFAAALTAIVATTASAQGPVAGRWSTDFELGMRNEGGVVTSMGTGKARITLEAKGDSVIGTWVTLEPADMAAAPARALRGVFSNGVLRLETEPRDQRLRINDEAITVKMLTRYELTLEGDALVGTSKGVALSGDIDPPSRPFKAVREKS